MLPASHLAGSSTNPPATVVRALSTFLLALVVSLVGAATSHAADTLTTDSGYTVETGACGQLGQSDQNGVYYTMCGAAIRRWDINGTRLADITLPSSLLNARDVAPSPDGAYLYVSQGTASPARLNRQANGSYTLDATWRLAQFTYWNTKWTPIGWALQTDGRGDIYVSNGSYWTGAAVQTSIAKYHPDGSFVTAFGDYGTEPGNWIVNMDVTVSRDGRRVYVGENCGTACDYADPNYSASRVTRYDFNAGGTYRFSRIISAQGPMDGNKFPRCTSAGATHSSYSLAMDYAENLYVTSTTCGMIQMFDTDEDPAKDVFVKTVATYADPATASGIVGVKNHYLSVDWAGRITAHEWTRRFIPKTIKVPTLPLPALAPLPEPDTTAPVVSAITLPATTSKQTVDVTIAATDDVAVTEMQLAREDGTWGPWQPFAKTVAYALSDGYGAKGVYVRVRDMAGNESNAVYKTVSYAADGGDGGAAPVGDKADPVVSAVSVPVLTATRDVSVTITATDDTGVTLLRLANEDGNWSAWKTFAAVTPWQLSAGNGAKAVYVQVRDGAGRESNTMMARSSVQPDAPAQPPAGGAPDATPPVLSKLELPAETTAQTITANLTATDDVGVAQVRFANEDGTWAGWQTWAASKQWKLTDGYGAKLVYAQVRDAVGNESAVLNARTSFAKTAQAAGPTDAADPALTSVTLPATTAVRGITVTLAATDDIGVTQVRFANEDGEWGAWQTYATGVTQQLTAGTGFKVVYAQVRDAAGRESNVLFARTQVTA